MLIYPLLQPLFPYKGQWDLAVEYCQKIDSKHPMVYSSLELGMSWPGVVRSMLGVEAPEGEEASLPTFEYLVRAHTILHPDVEMNDESDNMIVIKL